MAEECMCQNLLKETEENGAVVNLDFYSGSFNLGLVTIYPD
jgi:hypothetical protein